MQWVLLGLQFDPKGILSCAPVEDLSQTGDWRLRSLGRSRGADAA